MRKRYFGDQKVDSCHRNYLMTQHADPAISGYHGRNNLDYFVQRRHERSSGVVFVEQRFSEQRPLRRRCLGREPLDFGFQSREGLNDPLLPTLLPRDRHRKEGTAILHRVSRRCSSLRSDRSFGERLRWHELKRGRVLGPSRLFLSSVL